MARYLCVHCDQRFDSTDAKPRCPKCMRVHGIEKISEGKKAAKADNTRWVGPAIGLAIVAAAVGGWYWWAKRAPDTVTGEPPARPLEPTERAGYLRLAGVTEHDLSPLLESNEALDGFAERATSGASSARDKARKIVEAITHRRDAHAFVAMSLDEPRDTPPRVAARAYQWLARDGGRAEMYPLEVAAIAVAALRSREVPAMLAVVESFPGERTPTDPSGYLGYYAVAVFDGEAGHGTAHIYDPYGGRAMFAANDDVRVLTDVQAVGAAIATRAMTRLVHDGDSSRAFDDTTNALKLDDRSPELRGVRGAVLLSSGGLDEGVHEMEAAAEIRQDAPRRNNLAGVYLAKGDIDRATREVQAALESAPDFAGAHATLAALALQRGENEAALGELQTAQRLDPDLAKLPMLWANYYLADGDVDQAETYARRAVERRPHNPESHLLFAQVEKSAGHYEAMRREAHAALDAVPESQRENLRQVITHVLGPTALEEDPLAGGDDTGSDVPPGDDVLDDDGLGGAPLQLGGGSRLLGTDDGAGTAPPLGGEAHDGNDLLHPGDTSKIHLGEPGGGLHLDFNH